MAGLTPAASGHGGARRDRVPDHGWMRCGHWGVALARAHRLEYTATTGKHRSVAGVEDGGGRGSGIVELVLWSAVLTVALCKRLLGAPGG